MSLRVKEEFRKTGLTAIMVAILFGLVPGAFAQESSFDRLWSKPMVKHAAVGAAIGAGSGVLTDKTSVGRGAVAGGLAGLGTGALSQSSYLKGKPLVRNTLQGAVIGTSAGYATRSSKAKSAVLGAGAGAGYHYVRKYMEDRRTTSW